MSENNKEDTPRGLVKSIKFNPFPSPRTLSLGQTIRESLTEFNQNTAYIVRVENMSQPVVGPHYGTKEELCLKAVRIAAKTISSRYELLGVPFTIVDGTPWDKVTASQWGLDIVFINVFWDLGQPVIAVMLGKRKRIKCSKVYHMEDNASQFPLIFPIATWWTEEMLTESVKANVEKFNQNQKGRGAIYPEEMFYFQHLDVIWSSLKHTVVERVEYPIAAATYLNGVVWYVDRPYRHFHIVHSMEYLEAKEKIEPEKQLMIQGFLTNHGNFVTRRRAMHMAATKGIVINSGGIVLIMTRSDLKKRHDVEAQMGGLLFMSDLTNDGYPVAETPLYSEDLW